MMANSNVPATPSQEELREKENIKNVKNSEERETDNLNSNIDTDPLSTAMSTSEAVSREPGSSATKLSKVTKIPGPVALGPSSSTFQMSNRKYTSMLELAKGRQQSANDSGIQVDSSLSDVETSPPSTLASPVHSYRSEVELQLAEEQTLKELQRVVAEMEAQVALDDEEEMAEPEVQRESESQLDAPGQGSTQKQAPEDIQNNEEKSGPLAVEAEQESTHNKALDNVHDSMEKENPLTAQQEPLAHEPGQDVVQMNKQNLGFTEDQLVAPNEQEEPVANEPGQAHEPTADQAQINEVKSGQKEDPLAGQGSTKVLQDNQEMFKKPEPEPVRELLEPLHPGSEQKFPQIVVQDPSVESVEVHIQQAFGNINQTQEQVLLGESAEVLNGGAATEYERFLREQFEMPNQDLLGQPEPEAVAEADLSTTSETGLVAQPSQSNNNLDGSVGADRRMVRLEELLGNANNVDLLRRLLQIGADGNLIESEPDFGTQGSSEKDTEAETESGPGTSTASGTLTEASTEEDAEVNDEEDEDEDESDVSSQGLNKSTLSLVRRLFSGKLVSLACPILFCGLAAGLIYLSRKA